MQTRHPAYTILYDGECRICTTFAHFVKALGGRDRVRIRPIQQSASLLATLPPADHLVAMHAIAPDGQLSTGGEAAPAIVASVAGGPALESLLRSSGSVMAGLKRAYGVLVVIRGRLTCGIGAPSSARGLLP